MEEKTISYITQGGVCSRLIQIHTIEEQILSIEVLGGCNGNLQGLCSLLKGMNIREAISRLEGINCNNRGTSCPDQIAKALKSLLQSEKRKVKSEKV